MIEGLEPRPRVPEFRLFEAALSEELFARLARAVRAIGDEQLERNYTTTFWFPREAEPTNVAEEAIVELARLVDPGPACTGIEWWVGRLRQGQRLRFHFDRDMTIRKETGRYVHPIAASVLYLNAFPSSPTVILDQVPSSDGKSKVPEKSVFRTAFPPVPNHYVVFPGNRRHGVVPARARGSSSPADGSRRRLTLLVNYWERRPKPPICFDYDGTIYGCLREETLTPGTDPAPPAARRAPS